MIVPASLELLLGELLLSELPLGVLLLSQKDGYRSLQYPFCARPGPPRAASDEDREATANPSSRCGWKMLCEHVSDLLVRPDILEINLTLVEGFI